MVTKAQAMALRHGAVLHHVTKKGSDKKPVRCRVNGVCKTWSSRPEQFKIPVKYGLRTCFYITDDNAHEWEVASTINDYV